LLPFFFKKIVVLLYFVLQEMDETEKKLRAELDNVQLQDSTDATHSWGFDGSEQETKANRQPGSDADALRSAMLDKLEKKKSELVRCA
jgi:hypothetical protein